MDASRDTCLIPEDDIIKCPYGCKDIFYSSELRQHEGICPSTCFRCPCCPYWISGAEDFRMHSHNFILQPESEYFPVILNNKTIKVIESRKELYGCIVQYISKLERLWVSVKYMGSSSYSHRRYFKMYLKRTNGEDYQFAKQVAPFNNLKIKTRWAIEIPLKASDKDEQVQVQIKVYNRKAVFTETARNTLWEDMSCSACNIFMNGPITLNYSGYSTCQDCSKQKVEEDVSRNLAMESLSKTLTKIKVESGELNNEEVFKELECPICLDYMCEPIKTCVSGHSICGYCRSKLSICPICRQDFNVYRNLSLETVTSRIHYKCMNTENGCTFTTLPHQISRHERYCSYGFTANV